MRAVAKLQAALVEGQVIQQLSEVSPRSGSCITSARVDAEPSVFRLFPSCPLKARLATARSRVALKALW